ncbi:hypothetical protein OQA88_1671 [Cercophora sp. LCS_1]
MRLQTLYPLTLAVLTAALPQPQPQTRTPPTFTKVTAIDSFNVTDFTAAAVALSNRVSYHFTVRFCQDHAPVQCSVLGTTLSEELSSVPLTWCGSEENKVAFKWTKREDDTGAHDLVIRREVDSDRVIEEAQYVVPADETPFLGVGRFKRQVYDGPQNFSIPAFRYESNGGIGNA